MPFKRTRIKQIIEDKIKKDQEFAKSYYELLDRKKIGLSTLEMIDDLMVNRKGKFQPIKAKNMMYLGCVVYDPKGYIRLNDGSEFTITDEIYNLRWERIIEEKVDIESTAVFCDKDCVAICDFCKYYKDNGSGKDFEGEGICLIDNSPTDAFSACDSNFHCFRVKEN